MGWVDAGSAYLSPGAYHATVLLPEGATLQHVEVAPPCVHPIEPRGGWRKTAVTTTADVAMTVLQAVDLESELPPAGQALTFDGSRLQLENGSRAVESTGSNTSFRAGGRGARVLLVADVPESGLYTLSVLGIAPAGHRWLADGCRTCVVCPTSEAESRWRTILSGHLQKGRHVFAATLGPGALLQQLRLEPKKSADEDYLGTVERLGLVLGPAGPSRAPRPRRRGASCSSVTPRRSRAVAGCCARARWSPTRPSALPAAPVGAEARRGRRRERGSGGGDSGGGDTGGGDAGGGGGGGGGEQGWQRAAPGPASLPPASPTVPTRSRGCRAREGRSHPAAPLSLDDCDQALLRGPALEPAWVAREHPPAVGPQPGQLDPAGALAASRASSTRSPCSESTST